MAVQDDRHLSVVPMDLGRCGKTSLIIERRSKKTDQPVQKTAWRPQRPAAIRSARTSRAALRDLLPTASVCSTTTPQSRGAVASHAALCIRPRDAPEGQREPAPHFSHAILARRLWAAQAISVPGLPQAPFKTATRATPADPPHAASAPLPLPFSLLAGSPPSDSSLT